jgi:ABC-type polysaccharide/polyol phosphate export permease
MLFGFALSWVGAPIGLLVCDVETAQSAGFVWLFPLTFASSAFVLTAKMPGWLRTFADHQPVTQVVNAVRAFSQGQPVGSAGLQALLWCIGILVVFIPLSVWAYDRRIRRA